MVLCKWRSEVVVKVVRVVRIFCLFLVTVTLWLVAVVMWWWWREWSHQGGRTRLDWGSEMDGGEGPGDTDGYLDGSGWGDRWEGGH